MKNINIDLDINDYKTILSHRGKIVGLVGTCRTDKFIQNIDETAKSSFSIAKGILIKFIIHEEQSLFLINSCMGEISDLSSDDCEIIFGTELDNSIDKNMLNYEIIVTGL